MCPIRIDDLCCPSCKGDLRVDRAAEANAAEETERRLACTTCRRSYPEVEGVVDFLPADPRESSRGQRAMEAEAIVSIYESGWWRASPLFSLFARIDLEAEMSLVEKIAAPGPTARVLDLACGPGLYARRFAAGHPGREVIGLDLSWPMLRAATRKAREARIENLRFLHGEAGSLPFRDGSLDVVNCCGALHLFPDIPGALRELARVVRPEGRITLAIFRRGSGPLARLGGIAAERLLGLHPFGRDELEALLREAGFEPTIHHAGGVWMISVGERRRSPATRFTAGPAATPSSRGRPPDTAACAG